jgi:hypothetical protein
VEVARQFGHSPLVALNTYGHVFDELRDGERYPPKSTSAERGPSMRPFCVRLAPRKRSAEDAGRGSPCKLKEGGTGFEQVTSCL